MLRGWPLLLLLLVSCSSAEVKVYFPGFPESVQGLALDDCKLSSRSARKHLLRVGLRAREEGRAVETDGDVKVTISNWERGLVIGRTNLKANGEVVEVVLDGPANPGEHLVLSGNYAVHGKQYEFEQKCHVD